jgi:hypothetical protein
MCSSYEIKDLQGMNKLVDIYIRVTRTHARAHIVFDVIIIFRPPLNLNNTKQRNKIEQ